MDKGKNQAGTNSQKTKSQLCFDFSTNNSSNQPDLPITKVVSIKYLIEKQKVNLVKDIIRNTKSF